MLTRISEKLVGAKGCLPAKKTEQRLLEEIDTSVAHYSANSWRVLFNRTY